MCHNRFPVGYLCTFHVPNVCVINIVIDIAVPGWNSDVIILYRSSALHNSFSLALHLILVLPTKPKLKSTAKQDRLPKSKVLVDIGCGYRLLISLHYVTKSYHMIIRLCAKNLKG